LSAAPAPAAAASAVPAALARTAAAVHPAADAPAPGAFGAGKALFDGAAPNLSGRAGAPGPGWSLGSFDSEAGGRTFYKYRPGLKGGSVRVYAGGLALNESFESLYRGRESPRASQYFLWTRAHPPTAWTPTKSPLEADAKDLARLIVTAARESGAKSVELALHSYGAMVFQRMVQLRTSDARAARRLLAGSRVVLLNATTHYKDSERKTGREATQIADAARTFGDWLDMIDAAAAAWRSAARLNPLLWPQAEAFQAAWDFQREQALSAASRGAINMMQKDLAGPWPGADAVRAALLKDFDADSPNPGWQEALARRSADAFRLEFTRRDVTRLRRLGVRVETILAAQDQLLNWESEKLLLDLLGIPAPATKPAPGTVLSDPSGLFTARVVDGDHYFPLKKSAELSRLLER
ncbi:MAG: hypothetical protein KGM24_14375, partial [Elusimicrobia bacterium]|nr:hypothetical protein [Elusimicrobiota bacterium]